MAHRRSTVAHAVLALASIALAALTRWALDSSLGDRLPYTIFLAAVALIAWLTTTRIAIASLIACWLIAEFFFVPPRGAFVWRTDDAVHTVGSLVYFGVAGVIVLIADRMHRAQRTLRQKEQSFRRKLDNAAVGLTRLDRNLRYLSANREYSRIIGRPLQEIVGRTVHDVLGPAALRIIQPYIDRVLAGQTVHYETQLPALDGIWVSVSYVPDMDQRGEVIGWVASVADITERKRADDALRRSAETFANLVEQSPLGIYTVDSDFRIAHASSGCMPAFRHVQPVIGRDFAEVMRSIWPEPFATEAINIFRHTLDTGEPYVSPGLFENRKDTGAVEAYEWQINRFTMADGRYGVVCYFFDSTRLQQAQHALRESEQQLRLALTHAPILVYRADRDLRYTWIYNVADRFAHLNVIGKRDDEILPFEQVAGLVAFKREVLESGQSSRREIEFKYPDRVEWWDVNAEPLKDDHGAIVGLIVSAMDITDRKKSEVMKADAAREVDRLLAERTAQVQHAERALATAQRMAAVGTLASGLAHDMNNVLLPLGMRLDPMLAAANLSAEQRADFTVILALLDHLKMMARNLSLFAQDPQQEGIIGSTELASWCGKVQGLLESSLTGRDGRRGTPYVRLKCDIPAALPPVAIAPHRLTQAVMNMVHNARDAVLAKRPQGGVDANTGCITVEARSRSDGAAVLFRVIDDGCGMPPEVVRRATEPFFTTKHQPSAAGLSGSGMGLSLVRAIVEAAGGSIAIESVQGEGTTITLTLPQATDHHPSSLVEPRKAGPALGTAPGPSAGVVRDRIL